MEIVKSFEQLHLKSSFLAIGVFDGVHLGHQQIIKGLVREAHKAAVPAVVMTFHPHPMVVLYEYKDPLYLTSLQQRNEILADLGVDIAINQSFTKDFSQQSGGDFLYRLKSHLNFQQLWAGHDFALGRNRQADINALMEMSKALHYTLRRFDPIMVDNEVVSSSAIRALLIQGHVERASRLLGRPYQVEGLVVKGDGRGTALGIPTANVQPDEQMVIPKTGVYISEAIVGGENLKAITNIGIRPTFNGEHPHEVVVEVHILDFHEDIYAQRIRVNFIIRLRDEMKFQRVADLLSQVQRDIQAARLYFKESSLLDQPT